MATDITSAILLLDESEIDAASLKHTIDTLTLAIQRYTRILLLIHVEHTKIDSLTDSFQYLRAAILFFPAHITLSF